MMFSSISNLFIYLALFSGVLFILYSLWLTKKLPILTDIFAIMLSVTAGYSGIELCYFILNGTKKLGDYQDQKLVIILGGISVFWVALTTVVNIVRQVNNNPEIIGTNRDSTS